MARNISNAPKIRQVLDCASPLALSAGHTKSVEGESGGGPPHSKTLRAKRRPAPISELPTSIFLARVFMAILSIRGNGADVA